MVCAALNSIKARIYLRNGMKQKAICKRRRSTLAFSLSSAIKALIKVSNKAVAAITQNETITISLHGPPGNGKTTTLTLNRSDIATIDRGEKVLVSAPSNNGWSYQQQPYWKPGVQLLRVVTAVRWVNKYFLWCRRQTGKKAGCKKEIKELKIRAEAFRKNGAEVQKKLR